MRAPKRSVTEKRRAANQAAATHSTGPRTQEGKRRSAFNSFRHGLYATQDDIIRQAFSRAGLHPHHYSLLHQQLAASFHPHNPLQALLVEDLTRLYWLKNLSQRALAEWPARQTEQFRFQDAQRRHQVQRDVPTLEAEEFSRRAWRWLPSAPEKFEKVFQLLDQLQDLARRAQWGNPETPAHDPAASDAPDLAPPNAPTQDQKPQEQKEETSPAEQLLYRLYHLTFTWTGKQMQSLFAQCAAQNASPQDPLVPRLLALIGQERESLQQEQQLYEQERELKTSPPLSTSDPVLQPLSDTWRDGVEQETAFDRQIAAKIRLLLKLQAGQGVSGPVGDPEPVPAVDQGTALAAPPVAAPANSGCDAGVSEEQEPVPADTSENSGTNPKSRLSHLESMDDLDAETTVTTPAREESGAETAVAMRTREEMDM